MSTSILGATTISGVSFTGTSATRSTTGGGLQITTSDNTYFIASCGGAGTNTLSFRAGGFGFAIPSTATIDGFELLIERKRGNTGTGSCTDSTIQIHNGTSTVGTNKSTGVAFPTSDTNILYGGATDKWGLSYTPTDVNSANFAIQIITSISVTSGTVEAQYDLIQMTVHYTDTTGKKRSVSGGVSYFAGCAFY